MAAPPRAPAVAMKRCFGKLVEILYTQILVAIFACACFTIYRSTQVIGNATSHHLDNAVPNGSGVGGIGNIQSSRQASAASLSLEAQLRRQALDRLAKEAKQYEDDDTLVAKKKKNKKNNYANSNRVTTTGKVVPTSTWVKQQKQQKQAKSQDKNAKTEVKKSESSLKKEKPILQNLPPYSKMTASNKNSNNNNKNKEKKEEAPPTPSADNDNLLVQPDDFIYQKLPGESAPIVMEDYKLIFFAQAKVGCTVWKMLFRRMMGIDDWRDTNLGMPHIPERNGLKYLYMYNRTYASQILQSPQWTKAIFVRDPKERFLSAYLDKAVEEMLFVDTCCNRKRQIRCEPTPPDMEEFLATIHTCHDSHWDPQTTRMEPKYWPLISFVGHLETAQDDAKRLLKKLHIWEHYGLSGWGPDGDQSMFGSGDGLHHSNNAKSKVDEYLYPELQQQVEAFYAEDYQNPLFNFPTQSTTAKRSLNNNNKRDDSTTTDETALDEHPRPLVEPRDWIYRKAKKQGEAAPIVIEKYKLIFFAVPHVADYEFKQLFQRIMGVQDWKRKKSPRRSPDYDKFNEGLKFLYNYNLTYASHMMTSPHWTRAIFTRDPKERFVLAYRQTAVGSRNLLHSICCFVMPRLFCKLRKGGKKDEAEGMAKKTDIPTATEFLEGIHTCKSTHWDPQTERLAALYRLGIATAQKKAFDPSYYMKSKYWKYLNFVGSMDSAARDVKRLLEGVGAWKEFGESGWGDGDNNNDEATTDSFFTSRSFQKEELLLKKRLSDIITSPEMERQVEELYASDYKNPYFNLTKKLLYSLDGKTFRDEIKALEARQKSGNAVLVKREW